MVGNLYIFGTFMVLYDFLLGGYSQHYDSGSIEEGRTSAFGEN